MKGPEKDWPKLQDKIQVTKISQKPNSLKESKNDYNKLTLEYKGRDLGRLELN